MSTPGTRSRSVFVTGATGVVGRQLVPRLVALGHHVTAVGRSEDKRAWLDSQGARGVSLDLFDRDAVRRTFEEAGAEVVVNLATHIPSSAFAMLLPWAWRENDHIRREGSAALVDAALATGVHRFVQESFGPIYAEDGNGWIDESCPQRPVPYNRTVLDAERSAERFTERGGVGVVLRFAAFYGPDAILETMLASVRKGWAPLPGPADAHLSSLAHEDAATAVVAALDLPAGTYNVCDEQPLTRREFAAVLAGAAGVAPPRPLPGWLAALGGPTMELLSRSLRMSNAKLRGASGWTPRWPSAREGIPAAVAALGSHPAAEAA